MLIFDMMPLNGGSGALSGKALESMQHQCQKLETVAELFRSAGNTYKLINSWQSSGESYVRAAETVLQGGSDPKTNSSAARYYAEAGDAFMHCNLNNAVASYLRAIKLYNILGEHALSAELFKEIAKVYESDNNIDDALAGYEQAAEVFLKAKKPTNANQMLLKVATFASEKGDLNRAAELFEKIGIDSLTSRLGAPSSERCFYQCLLCLLATQDFERMTEQLDIFLDAGHISCESLEVDFIERLLKACLDSNLNDFTDACYDYDIHTPLTQWETNILLRIKCNMCEQQVQGVELGTDTACGADCQAVEVMRGLSVADDRKL